MKKLKRKLKGAIKKQMRKLRRWIIKKIKKAFESFNGFIAKQTWIITMFALIGAGSVLYLSGDIFTSYVKGLIDEKFTKVIVIENEIPKQEEEGIEIETKVEDITEEVKPQNSIEEEIVSMFPEEPKLALAIFKAESGLNIHAKGWNCKYGQISKACRPEDRPKAWSVDCGVAQINVPGQKCSSDLFNLDKNLEIAREKYEKRGWQPWVAYKNNSYKKYL